MNKRYRRTRARNTRNPTKKVVRRSGNEGPRHDPYGYGEYIGYTKYAEGGLKVVLHLGALCTWLKVAGSEQTIPEDFKRPGVFFDNKAYRRAERILIKRWERLVGTTIAAVDKFQNNRMRDPMGCAADYE